MLLPFFNSHSVMSLPEISSFLSLAAADVPGGGLKQFLPIILLFLGMWFLIIAPQRKRQKAHDKMLTEIKKGDEIVTTGGLFGTVTRVKDDRFVVEIADNTRIELGKSFVSSKIEATIVD